jgi:hypothetical protein
MSDVKLKLKEMTVEQLAENFAEIAVSQYQAELYGQYAKYNRLYSHMDAVDNELRARGEKARLALLSLYNHSNTQVRLKAAIHTLGVAPIAARNAIETIAKSKEYVYAMDAGMTIIKLDDGTFKPT